MMDTCNINIIIDGGLQLPVLGTHKQIRELLDSKTGGELCQFKCYGTLQNPTSPPKIVESTLEIQRSQIIGLLAMTGKTVLSPQMSNLLQG